MYILLHQRQCTRWKRSPAQTDFRQVVAEILPNHCRAGPANWGHTNWWQDPVGWYFRWNHSQHPGEQSKIQIIIISTDKPCDSFIITNLKTRWNIGHSSIVVGAPEQRIVDKWHRPDGCTTPNGSRECQRKVGAPSCGPAARLQQKSTPPSGRRTTPG